jgi:formylglycine-generating enzyme
MDSGAANKRDGGSPVADGSGVCDSASSPMDSGPSGDRSSDDGNEGGGDGGPSTGCPLEMVPVGGNCVDVYEASRMDATATNPGADESVAMSRAGVLPWYVNPMSSAALAKFEAACQAAGKRLCGSTEWFEACRGPAGNTYFFGNTWDPTACNSVDTYCQQCCDILGLGSCSTGENCGYSSALSSSPYLPETCSITADYGVTTCHVCFHVMPTGAFARCTNDLGLYDVNGNVWEVVPASTAEDSRGYQVRGGAFNCGSPSVRFQCAFNATWTDLYAGFRCCKDRS